MFLLYCLCVQGLENPKTTVVYSWCTFMCNTLPLDNSKTYSHPALLYITWGFIWDSKIKKMESLGLKFSTGQASGILKLRQEGEIPIENFCKLPVSQIQTAEKGFCQRLRQGFVLRLKIQQVGKGLQFTEKG